MRARTSFALVLLSLAACKGGDDGLGPVYFGKTVEPPRALAKLRPGMTVDEAKAAAPDLKDGSGRERGNLVAESGREELTLVAEVDDGRIDRLIVKARITTLEQILTKAWGAPTKVKVRDEERAVWLNPAGSWKVTVDCLERTCFLDFENHKPLDAAWFGKTPVPPGAYAKVQVGMPAAEAVKVLGDPRAVEGYVDAGPDDVQITVQASSKTQRVSSIRLMLPKESKPLIDQAWGPGLEAKDSIGRPLTVWLDEASGWRAAWEHEAIGDSGSLEFVNYLPLSSVLGTGTVDFALLAPAGLGATKDELIKAYGDRYQAKDDRIELPPTAWGSIWTAVHVSFDAAGKASYFRFGIPYEAQAQAKDQILAALEARFGKPTAGEDLGRPLMIFRDAAPRIVVRDSTITHEIEIEYGSR